MLKPNKKTIYRFCLIILCFLLSSFMASCAKLPMENDPPGAPVVFSDGVWQPTGVEIRVLVDDPDGDMVTLHFQATDSTGLINDFAWTSFIASGEEGAFFLGLSQGQWSITAQARDELDEQSPITSYQLTVSIP